MRDQLATKVCDDLTPFALSVHKSLRARLKERVKTAKQVRKRKLPCEVPKVIRERYGKSKQLRYVAGHAVVPVGYIRHKPPKSMNRKINSYTPEGRAEIHKNLDRIDMTVLHYLMGNPVLYRTIQYNDNRLSLYSAQMGKQTISMQTDSRSRGQSESYSQNTQRLGRELMTMDELTTMPGDKCILQLRGLRPFFSPKYDLKQHPNYRYTAEADKKNAFDLSRLISRRMEKLDPSEQYTVYEADVPDEANIGEDEDIFNYDDLDDPDAFV